MSDTVKDTKLWFFTVTCHALMKARGQVELTAGLAQNQIKRHIIEKLAREMELEFDHPIEGTWEVTDLEAQHMTSRLPKTFQEMKQLMPLFSFLASDWKHFQEIFNHAAQHSSDGDLLQAFKELQAKVGDNIIAIDIMPGAKEWRDIQARCVNMAYEYGPRYVIKCHDSHGLTWSVEAL